MSEVKPWDAVFERVRISRTPGDVWPTVPETELDAAEAELGVPLPASYRAFATRFGLGGEFWGLWRMPLLFDRRKKYQDYTVINWSRWMQDNIVDEYGTNMSLPQDQLRRFIFFGDDCGGGNFAWDPGEPTSTYPIEYPVYYYPRDHALVQRRADTFYGFVSWVDTYCREITDDEEEKTAADIRWKSGHVRKRKKPLKRDAKLWLAFNNGTARDLALSIRDEGRADAFPILADALQDAGCAHADLLDACRTGDPDIDGKWVLQVLLGKG